jgi:L-iditol 2-dehydrogenase
MQAVVKEKPGPGNVTLRQVSEPHAGPGQVVIEVYAAGVCGTDYHIFLGEYPAHTPVIMGHELAGVVAEVGPGVGRLQPGDRVTAETYAYTCGRCRYCRAGQRNLCPERLSIGSGVDGAFARYVAISELYVHPLPDNLTFASGALTEPLACCIHEIVDSAVVLPGDWVLVSGPGSMGLLGLQLVRSMGARAIVCGTAGDESRLDLALRLGADRVVNVTREDLEQAVGDLTGGEGVDVALECAGAEASARQCLHALRRDGRYVQIGIFGRSIQIDMDQVVMKQLQVTGAFAHIPSGWPRALHMMSSGQVNTEVLVTRRLLLAEWETAFHAFGDRQEIKILLEPQER